jgi:hypothetical protein
MVASYPPVMASELPFTIAPSSRSPQQRSVFPDFANFSLSRASSARNSSTSHSLGFSLVVDAARDQQSLGSIDDRRQSITHAFLDKCKLAPTTGVNSARPSRPTSTPARPNFERSDSINSINTTHTASKVRTHTRAPSQDIFEALYSNGIPAARVEPQYINGYKIEGPYTQAPSRSSSTKGHRRSSTARSSSSTVGSKFSGWLSGSRTATSPKLLPLPPPPPPPPTSKPVVVAPGDPLLNISRETALFPHGPVDPLDPTSFHDLLTNANSLISRLESAYKARCLEVQDVRAKAATKKGELSDLDTRDSHLKMQLDGMAIQLAAQQRKSDMIERMLEEERIRRKKCEEALGARQTSISSSGDQEKKLACKEGHFSSDSGFGSDRGSVYSVQIPNFDDEDITPVEDEVGHLNVAGGKRGEDAAYPSNVVASCQKCTNAFVPSALGKSELQDENQQLKLRVLELEMAVDGCVEMITNPWR